MSLGVSMAIAAIVCFVLCYATTLPADDIATSPFRPWMRVALVIVGLLAFFWMPWALAFAEWNFRQAFPEVRTEVER